MDDVAMDLHMKKIKNTRLIQRERDAQCCQPFAKSRRIKGCGWSLYRSDSEAPPPRA
jgi:hypothetical protein